MRGERGFALITALWLIAVLSAIVGLEVGTARLGQQTSLNRIILTRGRWAAEGCLAIVQGRWSAKRLADTATIDLGDNTGCNWHVDDPDARINVNAADPDVLTRALADSTLAREVVAARQTAPFVSVEQLPMQYRFLFTVDGPGTINLNRASDVVLSMLPGLTGEAVERISSRRNIGRPVTSLDELGGLLAPPARAELLAHYADLARIATFRPSQLVVTAHGWVNGRAPHATIEIVAVPLQDRLAVVRRRIW
ncbi:MAG TPA: hypothetical protein VNJ06_04390 [Gemmatimonadales bacterium]|nr:hypothetical protein [Gemmatimonadales bacterium]